MRYLVFYDETIQTRTTFSIGILSKLATFNKESILKNYINPISSIPKEEYIAVAIENEPGKAGKKSSAKFIREWLTSEVLPEFQAMGIRTIYVTDGDCFKVLTKKTKIASCLGYPIPCALKGYEDIQIILGISYLTLIYSDTAQQELDLSLFTLESVHLGIYTPLGQNILHTAFYPSKLSQIKEALDSLHQYPSISCDIETFSLAFNQAGIATIAFAWSPHDGFAFACDACSRVDGDARPSQIRQLLKEFFTTYQGDITWHNCTFDIRSIIYALWMEHELDMVGLLEGLHTMTQPGKFHDSMIIAYLALNSAAGNELSLKTLAHEFAGNWAVDDITDISKIDIDALLQYNLVDAVSTLYVKEKYYPIMVQDQQEDIYHNLMIPSLRLITQIELSGMPMCPDTLESTSQELVEYREQTLGKIMGSRIIQDLTKGLQFYAMEAANAKLKTKVKPIEDFKHIKFNPNSPNHMKTLLYDVMELPVIDYTDTKQPATGSDTLKKLVHHTSNPEYIELLNAINDFNGVEKILSTFIPAFENGITKLDGWKYLHGGFKLGGTISGRLSSNRPNMQNTPSGSIWGKTIKKIFKSPPGWIFAGADFNALIF